MDEEEDTLFLQFTFTESLLLTMALISITENPLIDSIIVLQARLIVQKIQNCAEAQKGV